MTIRSLRSVALLAAALCVAALPGCGDSMADVAGVYELDKQAIKSAVEAEIEASKDSDDPMAGMGAAMVARMVDAMVMELTLNADGTASMDMEMMGDSTTATGTWSLDGNAITISLAEEGEEPDAASGTIDGDTITMEMPEDDDAPFDLVFTRKKA